MFLETPPGGCKGPYPFHLVCDHEGNLYKTSLVPTSAQGAIWSGQGTAP